MACQCLHPDCVLINSSIYTWSTCNTIKVASISEIMDGGRMTFLCLFNENNLFSFYCHNIAVPTFLSQGISFIELIS